jgi:hypothetical protein
MKFSAASEHFIRLLQLSQAYAFLPLKAFIKDQYAHVPHPPKVNLSGKTIIVIGANCGLGFEGSFLSMVLVELSD